MPTIITTEIKDTILHVGITRPQKRNAVNDEMILEIDRIFSGIPKAVKCAMLEFKQTTHAKN